MLWPLGGVAYVNPPQRPGATLWSLAAGPLVNVALLAAAWRALSSPAGRWDGRGPCPMPITSCGWVLFIDVGLFVFNILPIYPLDGGQILRSLLWFFIGRARSLYVATILGFVGAAGLVGLALWMHSAWSLLIAAYMLMNCWSGFKSARALILVEKQPRREGFACPSCGVQPHVGPFWKCAQCSRNSTRLRMGLFAPIAELNFPTRCAASAKNRIPSASGRPVRMQTTPRKSAHLSRIGEGLIDSADR